MAAKQKGQVVAQVVILMHDAEDDEQQRLEMQLTALCPCARCCADNATLLMQAVLALAERGQLNVDAITKTASEHHRIAVSGSPHVN